MVNDDEIEGTSELVCPTAYWCSRDWLEWLNAQNLVLRVWFSALWDVTPGTCDSRHKYSTFRLR